VSSQAIIPVTVSSGQARYPSDAEDRLRKTFRHLTYIDAVGVAERLCDTRVANVILLGAMSESLDLPAECWQEAIAQCVKPKFKDMNISAFEEGKRLAVLV
jgi:indolepyruvate ferredoxin oxidoreductase beta subunit